MNTKTSSEASGNNPPINTFGFDDEQAEEILRRERERIDFVQAELNRQYWTGERDPNDADGVQTMRDFQ